MNKFPVVARIIIVTLSGRFHVVEFGNVRKAFDHYVELVDDGFHHVELHTYGALEPMSHTWKHVVAEVSDDIFKDTSPLAEWEMELLQM